MFICGFMTVIILGGFAGSGFSKPIVWSSNNGQSVENCGEFPPKVAQPKSGLWFGSVMRRLDF